MGWDLQRGGVRRRVQARDGVVLDVSVSGAAVRAPSDPELIEGRVLAIGHGAFVGHVMIRRVVPTERREQNVYGVEFVDTPVRLVEALIELSSNAEAPHPYEGLWALNT